MKIKYLAMMALTGMSVSAFAQVSFDLSSSAAGWFSDDGYSDPLNVNFFTGVDPRDLSGFDHNSYFSFDLSGITGVVTSASLKVALAADSYSGNGTEVLSIYDASNSSVPSNLTVNTAAYSDLGSGALYGALAVNAGDNGTTISIPLSSSFLSDVNTSGGLISIGGSLGTSDGSPLNGHIFANSELQDVSLSLVINPSGAGVPEPSSVIMTSLAGLVLLNVRNRKK